VRERQTERQRDRERKRQRDRETERQRDRETERQREEEKERWCAVLWRGGLRSGVPARANEERLCFYESAKLALEH
jgi:hypothetical protein